jgi:hypothetical protein
VVNGLLRCSYFYDEVVAEPRVLREAFIDKRRSDKHVEKCQKPRQCNVHILKFVGETNVLRTACKHTHVRGISILSRLTKPTSEAPKALVSTLRTGRRCPKGVTRSRMKRKAGANCNSDHCHTTNKCISLISLKLKYKHINAHSPPYKPLSIPNFLSFLLL